MQRESIEGFWEFYIAKAKSYKIPQRAVRWYVKRVEEYIKANPSNRLSQHTRETMENFLQEAGRNYRLADWQFKQIVESLKILFVDVVRSD